MPIMRSHADYQAFPEIQRRDDLQVAIEVPLVVTLLGLPVGARVVELGCGSGAALVALHRLLQPSHLAAVDVDPTLLDQARLRCNAAGVTADLRCADVRNLPFGDGSFDVVIDFGTCYHITKAGTALQEISRVLSGNGLFVHETKVSQFMAHPIRSFGRRIPWDNAPDLTSCRSAVLWAARRKGPSIGR